MKSLVLAEKPSVARDIARVLGCHKNISGAIEGSNYIVTWALGHLVTLADPEEYDNEDYDESALVGQEPLSEDVTNDDDNNYSEEDPE